MARVILTMAALALLMAAPAQAQAQEQSVEDRLRDALRKSTVELRALQDSTAGLQAQLDQTTKQRDLLQQQLDTANARPAAAPTASVAPDPELATLREAVQQLRQQNQALQQGLAKWQAAYAQAASLAQAKDAQAHQSDAAQTRARQTLGICVEKNKRLLATASDILHLYQTQDFRSILLGSYEPLLGLKRVELENIVQNYDDRIRDQTYYGNELPTAAAKAPGP